MKKQDYKHLIILSLVIIIGVLFRLANLDKPYGLWLDEMISYNTAHGKSLLEIINYSFSLDMHAPLYYLLFNVWMNVFGDADVTLRLFSVIPGILTVVFVYLLGKEVDSRETGLLAAFFCGISSFLIHYSQEVRLYSLTALLATMSIYFVAKMTKPLNGYPRLNMAGFILSNVLLMYTHTIGFLFVFFELLFFGIHVIIDRKELLKGYILSSFAIVILFIPFISRLFVLGQSQNVGVFAQWWCKINLSKIAFSVGDLFSPLLMNVYGLDLNYINFLFFQDGINYPYIQYSVIPTLIMIMGLVFAIKNKNRYINLILLTCAGFLAVFTGAYLNGKLIFITRYIIEVAPLLLLVSAFGLLKIRDKRFRYGLISTYVLITIMCMVGFSISGYNDNRISGHKTPISVIQRHNLDKDSKIISIFYDTSYFTKYYPESQGATFSDININNFRDFLPDNQVISNNFTKKNFYSSIKPFISGENTAFYDNKMKKEFIDPLPKGKYIVILTDKRFHCFNDKYLKKLTADDAKYRRTEIPLMLFSRFTEALLKTCDKELTLIEKRHEQRWELYFYRKP